MSTMILSLCWPINISPTQKLVLISLADQANDEGVCWPSIASLTRRTCLSERAVRNALRALEDVRLLRTNGRDGSSNWYTLTPRAYTPAADAPRHDVPPPPAPDAGHPGTTCPPPRHDVPPEPSLNHQGTVNEPPRPRAKRAARKPTAAIALPSWVPAEAWAGWLEMRDKARKSPTDRAQGLALRELESLRAAGHDPQRVIDQSTRNNWLDFYAIKPEKGNAATHPTRGRPSLAERVRANEQRTHAREAAAAGATHGDTLAEDDGHLRAPLDGSARRVG